MGEDRKAPQNFLLGLPRRCPTPSATIPCMKIEIEFMQTEVQVPVQFTPQPNTPHLPINEALQIKAAEYWLKLGEADEALRELESLPQRTWNNPAAVKVRVAAIGVLRERSEVACFAVFTPDKGNEIWTKCDLVPCRGNH